MAPSRPWNALRLLAERESLRPDLGRAIRCTLAFMAPLLLAAAGRLPVEAVFAALAAQNVAMADVRGAYSLRFRLLLVVAIVLAGSAGLGGLVAQHLPEAVVGMGLIALAGGLWRHLSSDYGPAVAVATALLYLLGLAEGGAGMAVAGHHLLATLAGGLWGVLLQVAFWPFRPQHPLRRAVSDSWLAVADLFAALAPGPEVEAGERHRRVAAAEAEARATRDHGYGALAAALAGRPRPWVQRLEALHRSAAQLSLRVGALQTALETLMAEPGFAELAPSFQTVLTGLTNLSRTVALAVVSRQPSHLAAADVRRRRLTGLLQVLRGQLQAGVPAEPVAAQVAEVLGQIEASLPGIGEALRATIGRADERAAFSLELFDLEVLSLRPLASALNLRARIDPALVRHSARVAVLTMLGVVAFKRLHLPHGYWLPFTAVVVLQPDYGSTRRRAAQRMLGTLAGSILASLTMWLQLPFAALMAALAAASFVFTYFVKRNYGVAVVFVTLFVVLLTEMSGPVPLAFTEERLASTTVGGLCALGAALVFWPVWERNRFPAILAAALRANRDYLRVLAAHLAQGLPYDPPAAHAKRHAERANGEVFSSLERMMGDPRTQQDRLEQAAALANGNQRLTRALNVVSVHLASGPAAADPAIGAFAERAASALDALARRIEGGLDPGSEPGPDRALGEALRRGPEAPRAPAGAGPTGDGDDSREQRPLWISNQFARAATELSAMLLASEAFSPAPAAPPYRAPASA